MTSQNYTNAYFLNNNKLPNILNMCDTHMEQKLEFIIKIYFIVHNCELELLFSSQRACAISLGFMIIEIKIHVQSLIRLVFSRHVWLMTFARLCLALHLPHTRNIHEEISFSLRFIAISLFSNDYINYMK